MAEQCHEQSNPFQVECHCLIFSLRLKTANFHSVKVKIKPMYTKLRIILTQYGGTEVVACIWVGMADATIASTCIHYNGHLICVQGPVVGEINIFPLILFHLACGNLTCQSKIRKNRIFCQHYWHSHILHFFWLQKAGSPISGKALFQHDQAGATDYGYCLSCMYVRVVTKISSCQVNTTSRHGIMQLGSFFLSYFPSIFFFLLCWANSMLKSLFTTFTHAEWSYMYIRRYQTNFISK